MRNYVIVLGDQLDRTSAAFDGFDADRDAVWMAEVEEEATYLKQHRLRISVFFSLMRHFRDDLLGRGYEVHYHAQTADRSADRGRSFREVLRKDVGKHKPDRLIVVQPGDHRVLTDLREEADDLGVPLEVRADRHFLCSTEEFERLGGLPPRRAADGVVLPPHAGEDRPADGRRRARRRPVEPGRGEPRVVPQSRPRRPARPAPVHAGRHDARGQCDGRGAVRRPPGFARPLRPAADAGAGVADAAGLRRPAAAEVRDV